MTFTADTAIEWVDKRAKKFIDETLRDVAVEDYSRYPQCARGDVDRVKENFNKYVGGKSIDHAECAGFANKVFGFLSNPSCKVDKDSPSVVQVGFLPDDPSYGHNAVLVSADLAGGPRDISLDPLPPEAAAWVVVDGWRAGLGWDYDDCVFAITDSFVDDWGRNLEVIKGRNPEIPIDFLAVLRRKKRGRK